MDSKTQLIISVYVNVKDIMLNYPDPMGNTVI